MLKLEKVTKSFNVGTPNEKCVLKKIDLILEEGDFVTVIGGNGAGKSTMLNMIAGVYPIDCGIITLDGKDISLDAEFERAKSIGRVFQDPMMGTAADMQIIEKAVKSLGLGLEERLTSKVGLLSGGQRQALTLLMATLNQPKLLLLDEHTAALDPATSAKVLAITNKIVTEQNLTTLMVTHNMKDAIDIGNRLIMMYDGHIIYDVKGEEKKNLEVADLLKKFEEAIGEEFVNDRMLLG